MKLQEAIEIKEASLKGENIASPLELRKAEQLGIEALKLIQAARRNLVDVSLSNLPGEDPQ